MSDIPHLSNTPAAHLLGSASRCAAGTAGKWGWERKQSQSVMHGCRIMADRLNQTAVSQSTEKRKI
ncbi:MULTISPECIES: hypothetical protein [Lonsdalea]|uniref:hypothetical protein n=1 Tax=Lonsdalea TaxID=1082702 RepID=UPI00116061A2|nr:MULTISPECIES: hypothetical protein [Lonsdalea]